MKQIEEEGLFGWVKSETPQRSVDPDKIAHKYSKQFSGSQKQNKRNDPMRNQIVRCERCRKLTKKERKEDNQQSKVKQK